jgi:hypothetical protein
MDETIPSVASCPSTAVANCQHAAVRRKRHSARLTETAVVPESRPLKGFVHDGIWFSWPLIESLQAERSREEERLPLS